MMIQLSPYSLLSLVVGLIALSGFLGICMEKIYMLQTLPQHCAVLNR